MYVYSMFRRGDSLLLRVRALFRLSSSSTESLNFPTGVSCASLSRATSIPSGHPSALASCRVSSCSNGFQLVVSSWL